MEEYSGNQLLSDGTWARTVIGDRLLSPLPFPSTVRSHWSVRQPITANQKFCQSPARFPFAMSFIAGHLAVKCEPSSSNASGAHR